MLTISSHAIDRAMERLPGVRTEADAIAALDTPVTRRAAAFGARYVRLGTGQRVVLDCDRIVTVLPKGTWAASLDRRRTAPFESVLTPHPLAEQQEGE